MSSFLTINEVSLKVETISIIWILLAAREESNTKCILGTFAMIDTARFLQDNLKRKDQVIILTGAKTPIGFVGSDGPANLNLAVEKLAKLQPGAYLCMYQQIFTLEEVAKNIDEGKFYSVFREEQ